jgi:hypothetical protein
MRAQRYIKAFAPELIAVTTLILAMVIVLLIYGFVHRLQDEALGECNRVQALSEQVNRTDGALRDMVLLSTQIAPQDIPKQFRKLTLQYRARYERDLKEILRISHTNCSEATKHPLTYKLPKAAPFP